MSVRNGKAVAPTTTANATTQKSNYRQQSTPQVRHDALDRIAELEDQMARMDARILELDQTLWQVRCEACQSKAPSARWPGDVWAKPSHRRHTCRGWPA